MRRKHTFTLSDEAKNRLERMAKIKTDGNMSLLLEDLILKNTDDKLKALVSINRENEKQINILLAMMNSFLFGFPSLANAEFKNPDTNTHPILTGAINAQKMKTINAMREIAKLNEGEQGYE